MALLRICRGKRSWRNQYFKISYQKRLIEIGKTKVSPVWIIHSPHTDVSLLWNTGNTVGVFTTFSNVGQNQKGRKTEFR